MQANKNLLKNKRFQWKKEKSNGKTKKKNFDKKNEKYEESLMLRTTRVERFLTICKRSLCFGFERLHS